MSFFIANNFSQPVPAFDFMITNSKRLAKNSAAFEVEIKAKINGRVIVCTQFSYESLFELVGKIKRRFKFIFHRLREGKIFFVFTIH